MTYQWGKAGGFVLIGRLALTVLSPRSQDFGQAGPFRYRRIGGGWRFRWDWAQ